MSKYLDYFSRLVVGGLFIFSGLIKINDPIGTEVKMEEYFEVFAQDFGSFFEWFIPGALEIGMILIVLELALGVAILINYRMKITTWVLLGLMVFFTFLTFYSAYFNKVTDCGCFGDAIKLTPWESFTKDVILMVFVLHLFWYRKRMEPLLADRVGHITIGATVLVSVFLGVNALRHLPYIDFRPYKVGNNIPEQMLPPEEPIIEYVFEVNGEEISSPTYIVEPGYNYVSSRVVNEENIKPPITDYLVTSPSGEDLTPYTFEGPKLMIIIYDVEKASTSNLDDIRTLTSNLEGRIDAFILTSSSAERTEAFRHEYQLAIPFYFADATVLKTIIRSNPGITLWNNGTVLGNWHHNDTPSEEEIISLLVR